MKKKLYILLLALGVLGFFFYEKGYNQQYSYLSGDEPHYIMMTDSLSKDGDFNLRNDYELGRSQQYFPGPSLEPHRALIIEADDPEWYSIHTIGLPLILFTPYHILGQEWSRFVIMILQFSIVPLFYFLLKRYTESSRRALFGTGILLLCPLLWQNFGSIFPDMLNTAIAILIVILFGRTDRLSNLAIMVALLAATLLHSKALVLLLPIVFMHLLWIVKKEGYVSGIKKQWPALVLLSIGALSYMAYLYVNYGILSPSQLYGGTGQLFSINPIYNITAMFTDRSKGLFVHFPLLLVAGPFIFRAISGLWSFGKVTIRQKKYNSDHFLIIGLFGGFILLSITLISFFDWSGSTAPNGRNVLPFIVVFIFLATKYFNPRNFIEIIVVTPFVGLCAWLSWLSITNFPTYMSTGVNSFWVDHFTPLENLPLFGLSSIQLGRQPLIDGLKILIPVALLNAFLVLVLNYKISIRPRVDSN